MRADDPQVLIRLPADLKHRLDLICLKKHKKRQEVLEKIILQYVEKNS